MENEALALLEQDSDGNRRYTFAELMMRARGYPAPRFRPAQDAEVGGKPFAAESENF